MTHSNYITTAFEYHVNYSALKSRTKFPEIVKSQSTRGRQFYHVR